MTSSLCRTHPVSRSTADLFRGTSHLPLGGVVDGYRGVPEPKASPHSAHSSYPHLCTQVPHTPVRTVSVTVTRGRTGCRGIGERDTGPVSGVGPTESTGPVFEVTEEEILHFLLR